MVRGKGLGAQATQRNLIVGGGDGNAMSTFLKGAGLERYAPALAANGFNDLEALGDRELLASLLHQHQPRAVLHFAAESHVDRSIHGPLDFIQTNVVGTCQLLESVRAYWNGLNPDSHDNFDPSLPPLRPARNR